MNSKHLDFILHISRNQLRSQNLLNCRKVLKEKVNFIVCKLFINGPDFKKKEIKQQGWKMDLAAAAAAKSLQSCPTLCDPIDRSPPGSPIPGILQAKWILGASNQRFLETLVI